MGAVGGLAAVVAVYLGVLTAAYLAIGGVALVIGRAVLGRWERQLLLRWPVVLGVVLFGLFVLYAVRDLPEVGCDS